MTDFDCKPTFDERKGYDIIRSWEGQSPYIIVVTNRPRYFQTHNTPTDTLDLEI